MCVDAITSTISSIAAGIWQFLNSSIAIAFIGGLVGALGGALGAQRIVERSRKHRDRLRELRYTNAAIMLAHSICNSAIALKGQHVQAMRDGFLKQKSDFEAFRAKREAGQVAPDIQFHLQMDLRTYPALTVPIETLKTIVFQELSTVGRPLALVSVIEQSLIGLSASITKRDVLIQKFASGEIPDDKHVQYYLGLPIGQGHTNREYPDLVDAIYSYVDDLAFFSYQLCVDLMKHGEKVQEALIKGPPKQVPQVSEVDFSRAKKSGLIPPDSQYSDWTNAFIERSSS